MSVWQCWWLVVLGMATSGIGLQGDVATPGMLPLRLDSDGLRSTGEVLRHIGMTRVKSPPLHRKRLASQSRKAHSGDSNMYIIKLPHNPYYYGDHSTKSASATHPNSVNKIPLSFESNGKPGKIYHWNLPVVKKMMARKAAGGGTNRLLASGPLWDAGDHSGQSDRQVSYYKPKPAGKTPFHKYFPGNGKPHALYVIGGKGRGKGTARHQQRRFKQ